MDAGFVAEQGGGSFAFDEQDGFTDAAKIGVREGHQFAFPAFFLSEPGVGPHQLGSEERGFFSSGTGPNFYKSITRIVGIGGDD